ncbi:MAG: hypothetical protein ABI794_05975, partial [Betaproteobacteria bacterium]
RVTSGAVEKHQDFGGRHRVQETLYIRGSAPSIGANAIPMLQPTASSMPSMLHGARNASSNRSASCAES